MRNFFLITALFLSMAFQAFSQTSIDVSCDETWGPGRYNKVTITIIFAGTPGFARFTQDFPVGLETYIDNPGNGDFISADNQVNIVWMKLPENKKLSFSYFVKPDKQMKGSFLMNGKFVTVAERTVHGTINMQEKSISVEGINGILPDQMKVVKVSKVDSMPAKAPVSNSVEQKNRIVFKIQVSVTSGRISEKEFNKKLGIGIDLPVKIVQSGKLFKYQAGEFSSYDSANEMLKNIIAGGFKDAFIVAYEGEEQIPVAKALKSQR
jgi:hypothetical protein